MLEYIARFNTQIKKKQTQQVLERARSAECEYRSNPDMWQDLIPSASCADVLIVVISKSSR